MSKPQVLEDTPTTLNADKAAIAEAYLRVRKQTTEIAAPLSDEDQCVQAMEDTSPIKWHLGHTTWFFETVVLSDYQPNYEPFSAEFLYHFNSYYEALGPRQPRPKRGLITRPSVKQVNSYREQIDVMMEAFIAQCDEATWLKAKPAIVLGLNHEQQHQELMLTDLKYLLYQNPFEQRYLPSATQPVKLVSNPAAEPAAEPIAEQEWLAFDDGLHEIGYAGDGFCYDNETPRHRTYLQPFKLSNRLVTCGEYLAFMQSGGYSNPAHWLSDGWAQLQLTQANAPLYWQHTDEGWQVYTLYGFKPIDLDEPVTHISYYEANAYANWAGARLPREAELELAMVNASQPQDPMMSPTLHPTKAHGEKGKLLQAFNTAWQWTSSGYEAYPGFTPFEGTVAEYNGKFMVNQLVLRGGSCVTPTGHSRPSYRNFFPAGAQWQFFGIRLAKDY